MPSSDELRIVIAMQRAVSGSAGIVLHPDYYAALSDEDRARIGELDCPTAVSDAVEEVGFAIVPDDELDDLALPHIAAVESDSE